MQPQYKVAKAAGTLDGMSWDAFRNAQIPHRDLTV